MSQAIVSPTPTATLRRFAARVWADPDTRSTAIGVLGVILVHLLLLLFGPHLLRLEHAPSILRPHSSARQFNIEIAPETFTKPQPKQRPAPPPPKQFVETNPDAPENIPDKTNNFAAQNQQVAQEKATPNASRESERPAMEGKKDTQSTQIVSGQLRKMEERIEPAPQAQPAVTPPSLTAPRPEQNPLPGFEKTQGDNPNAFGTNIAQNPDNARPIPERIDGAKNVPLIEGATSAQPTIDPKHPRPRPSIVKQQQVRPAILAENKIGTPNLGVTAINAKFSNYGAYLQRLVEAVQIEWDGLLVDSKTYPPSGTFVVVRFFINAKGEIARFGDIDNHSSTWGAKACSAAISNRAPYGEWTDDMKAALNPDGEELVFTFYYQ